MANTAATVPSSAPLTGRRGGPTSSATRTVVAGFGLVVALAGLEHGVGEMLEGPVAPPDLVFQSWPDTAAFSILNGEPALSVIPNLLVTGIVATALSIALAAWVMRRVGPPRWAAGILVLSVLLLLFGGGLFPPVIGIVLALAAARIGATGRAPGAMARRIAPAWRVATVLGIAGYLGLFPGLVLASALVGVEEAALVLLFAALAFGGLVLALFAARASDRHLAHAAATPDRSLRQAELFH
jgi:hypothetical protein